ncbi:MAG: hypothetical protein KAS32_27635 [Candidatus Peribacteraceae bacterium]|nr:hypothetical protein [Candidatus Peribacteraceae bacterium]
MNSRKSEKPEEAVGRKNIQSKRPIKIFLIKLLDEDSKLKLKSLCKNANKHQKLFEYRVLEGRESLLGDMDKLHCYSDEQCFAAVKSVLKGTGYNDDYGIGITSQEIEENAFNRHNHLSGAGMVTTCDAEEYKPLSVPLEKFMTYLILCESCCIAGSTHFEHEFKHSCLFDICRKKKEITKCIDESKICAHCETELSAAGFKDSDIEEIKKLLFYIKKPDILYGIKKGLNNPFAGFLGGNLMLMTIYSHVEKYILTPIGFIIFILILISLISIIVGIFGFGIKFTKWTK